MLDWELTSLKGKNAMFSLKNKSNILTMIGIVILCLILSFVFPFIPPRFNWGNWSPPTTIEDYKEKVTSFVTIIPIIIVTIFLLVFIRNTIDESKGIKRIKTAKIVSILNLLTIKILLLDNWNCFVIRVKKDYFKFVQVGQIITIQRTWSFKLIDYYIRTEEKFNEENKIKKASH